MPFARYALVIKNKWLHMMRAAPIIIAPHTEYICRLEHIKLTLSIYINVSRTGSFKVLHLGVRFQVIHRAATQRACLRAFCSIPVDAERNNFALSRVLRANCTYNADTHTHMARAPLTHIVSAQMCGGCAAHLTH